ncbi:MAG: glycoside hydrolase family 10 protein [Bacteroidota bacterium]
MGKLSLFLWLALVGGGVEIATPVPAAVPIVLAASNSAAAQGSAPATGVNAIAPEAAAAWERIRGLLPEIREMAAQAPVRAMTGEVSDSWQELVQQVQEVETRARAIEESLGLRQPVESAIYRLEADLADLYVGLMPSRGVEIRILAVDASSFSRLAASEGEIGFLARLARGAGFNAIFVETLRDDGYLIYPSPWGEQAPDLAAAGRDPLQELIVAAHEEGLAVFPWIKLLFATATGELGPVVSRHPEWAAVNQDGKLQTVPYNFVWLNPAHPEVRDFLANQIADLARRYEIDGLQFDYVRYPNNYGTDLDYSYDPVTLEQFQSLYGFDPRTLKPIPSGRRASADFRPEDLPAEYQAWNAFRQEIISSLLFRVVGAARQERPGLAVSVAPIAAPWGGGTYQQALLLHQNWPVWVERRIPTILSPLTYTGSPAVLRREMTNVAQLAQGRAMLAPSLSILSIDESPWGSLGLLQEMRVVQQQGAAGYRVFAYPHLRLEHWRLLREGAFRQPAVDPVVAPAKGARAVVDQLATLVNGVQKSPDVAGFSADELASASSYFSRILALRQVAARLTTYVEWYRLERNVTSLIESLPLSQSQSQSQPQPQTSPAQGAFWAVVQEKLLQVKSIAAAETWRLKPAGLGYGS